MALCPCSKTHVTCRVFVKRSTSQNRQHIHTRLSSFFQNLLLKTKKAQTSPEPSALSPLYSCRRMELGCRFAKVSHAISSQTN